MRCAAFAVVAAVGCAADDGVIESGPVSVVVTRDARPVAGVTVIFQAAAGAVIGRSQTDASGVASGEISTQGMVTVVDPALEYRLITVARPAIGATLEVPLTAMQRRGEVIGMLTIDAPPGAPPAETASYDIQTPCTRDGALTLPTTIPLHEGCGSEVPVIVTARTPNLNLEDPGRALAYVAGVATNGRFSPGAWSTECESIATNTEPIMALRLWPRLGDHVFRWLDLGFCQPVAPPPGFMTNATLDFARGGLAHGFGYLDGSLRTASVLVDHARFPTTIEIARDVDLLVGDPELVRFDGAGATWTADPALARADAIVADMSWSPAPLSYVTWRFVLPGDATTARVPELPSDVQAWPSLHDALEVIVELRYLDASWTDDLATLHDTLPLAIDGAASTQVPPPNGMLIEYGAQFHP